MGDVVVRERRDADLPGCVAAMRSVHETDGYPVVWPAEPERWLTPGGTIGAWVAEVDGVVAGQALLCRAGAELAGEVGMPEEELAAVARLFVGAVARKRGAAGELLARVTEEAQLRGLQPVLEVETRAAKAIALYERTGWQRVSTRLARWRRIDGSRAHVHTYVRARPATPADQGLRG
ncbi:GNAT family N-acetyltransferase [Kitasatospora sp. NPDC002227]|uniref:GNAT family N-acetyltransferase n=1 Tax=Kitasatospora sp. NPDC002227 TaxID=3154773 RepID=UPI00332D501F